MEKSILLIKHSLDMLILNLISMIDKGYKESFDTIEKHMYDENLLEFLIDKYDEVEDFEMIKINTYSIKDLNNYICGMANYASGRESRKYGVANEKNGLLLLVSVCYGQANHLVAKLKKEEEL